MFRSIICSTNAIKILFFSHQEDERRDSDISADYCILYIVTHQMQQLGELTGSWFIYAQTLEVTTVKFHLRDFLRCFSKGSCFTAHHMEYLIQFRNIGRKKERS